MNNDKIIIKGARENNLKNVNVKIPLGCMVLVTGVSGSGKSSLVNEILWKATYKYLNKDTMVTPGKYSSMPAGLRFLSSSGKHLIPMIFPPPSVLYL